MTFNILHNTTNDYIAIDLGATSGRVMLGRWNGATLYTEEIHRFGNSPVRTDDGLCWDMPAILGEIRTGIARAAVSAANLVSIGCDSWAADHGFVDARGESIGLPFSYQDARAINDMNEAQKVMSAEDLQRRVAAPISRISTLYQLLATRRAHPDMLARAAKLLFIPDLVHYDLCGSLSTEETMASTSAMLSCRSRGWDNDVLKTYGLPREILPDVAQAGALLGPPRDARSLGLPDGVEVRTPAGHDTACAFGMAPARLEKDLILSSGTWSMLGFTSRRPVIVPGAVERGFGSFRITHDRWMFCGGIMGLWLLERLRREENMGDTAELCALAAGAPPLVCVFDPGNGLFAECATFRQALAEWGRRTQQRAPETIGGMARSILESLALFYAESIETISRLTGKTFENLIVLGGGSKNNLLNRMTANATGLTTLKGVKEASAIGNIMTQAAGRGDISSPEDRPEADPRSLCQPESLFTPTDRTLWQSARERFDKRKKQFAESSDEASGVAG
ncbi:MAG: FGGY family carbohydrate kinase [Candidatus Sumerlaeota bacterium]|nr:FGGY family carbohydrate kinase [Candidatus Sumerlaeota bacterium]